MNIPINPFMWIMAFLPIVVLLVLMIKFQWGATEAAPIGLLITVFTGIVFYKADIKLLAAESAKGIWNALVILLIVNFLPRRLVVLVMLLSCLFSILLITYFEHFHAPLSEQVMLSQSSEATEFSGYALDVINWKFTGAIGFIWPKSANFTKSQGGGPCFGKRFKQVWGLGPQKTC